MQSPYSNSSSLTQKLIDKEQCDQQVKGINGQNVKFVLPQDIQEEGIINEIQSYRIQQFKLIFSYFLFFITGGLLYIFTRWSINLKIRLQMIQCKSSEAQLMKIISAGEYQKSFQYVTINILFMQKIIRFLQYRYSFSKSTRIFSFRLNTYFYVKNSNCFYPIQFALSFLTNNQIYNKYGRGVQSEENLKQLVSIYRLNNTEIPDKSTFKILIDEVLSPFYIFQIFSVTLWMLEPYYYYASVIFFTSLLSAVVSLLETKNNYKKLKQMSFFETPVFVLREAGKYIEAKLEIQSQTAQIQQQSLTVPPALPTCLSIGKVTIMCFDKTGTLTEEGLDMYGLRPVFYSDPKSIKFARLLEETAKLGSLKLMKMNGNPEQLNLYGEGNPFTYFGDPEMVLKECMASCHGLTRIDGDLIGDPLEVKIFEATQWKLIENNLDKFNEVVMAVVEQVQNQSSQQNQTEKSIILSSQFSKQIGIVKRFEFLSKLQRMSTIVKRFQVQNEFYRLYVKGSPEKIFELCKPETIPQNFHEVLDFYARTGFRVLAFGIKILNMY
ncbi:hypothetical protein ABPG72_016243 [Tetrahymena utriculariae]